jgi:hypothetical protein
MQAVSLLSALSWTALSNSTKTGLEVSIYALMGLKLLVAAGPTPALSKRFGRLATSHNTAGALPTPLGHGAPSTFMLAAFVAELPNLLSLIVRELPMVLVEIDAPNEVDLVLQVPLVEEVLCEALLEVARDFLLHRLIGNLGGTSQGAIATGFLGTAGQFEGATSMALGVALGRVAGMAPLFIRGFCGLVIHCWYVMLLLIETAVHLLLLGMLGARAL